MFSNFFKTALRNIFRHKTYVVINILGLAVGFACSLLIFLFVIHELSYDKFNEKYDRIYRLYLVGKMGGSGFKGAWTAAPTARTFVYELPEVETAVRMTSWDETLVRLDDRRFLETRIALADSGFFDIFSFKLLKGRPDRALAQPNSVVLTVSQAKKYFADSDPMGAALRIGNDTTIYTITGVMEDLPENSNFEFTILISFASHPRANDPYWLSNSFTTYVLMRKGADVEAVQSKIPAIVEKYIGPQVVQTLGMDLQAFRDAGNEYGIYLQPLSEVHLDPSISAEFKQANDRKYIYIFSAVAVLIIIVAGINYMNLSTARSIKRSKEVGLRKAVGSSKGLLIRQFLVESAMLSIISMIIAIILVELLLPVFNNMLQTNLSIGYFQRWYVIPGLLILALLVGFFSGSYPAWFLSSFVPVKVLYGKMRTSAGGAKLRSMLVVLQFTISIILIMSSFVIYKQIRFMVNKDLGFDKEQLLIIRRTESLNNKISAFKQELKKLPAVINVTNSTAVPGYPNNNNGFQIEGRPAEEGFLMWVNWIDYDYFDTYRIPITEGRAFSREYSADTATMIINEEAVRRFGLTDPFATRIIQPGETFESRRYFNVLAINKDFHNQPLRYAIEPHVFMLKPDYWDWTGYITIRIDRENMAQTLKNIELVWSKFTNNEPLQYAFLDREFEQFYREERRTAKIAVAFSVLAIFIACLGLFGLTSFATEQRAREISLRKVLGSSEKSIIILFSREFSVLVSLAVIPAGIISYYFMNKWLNNFEYRINPGYLEFVCSIAIVFIIALLTVGYRTYKASQTNPAEILKYE